MPKTVALPRIVGETLQTHRYRFPPERPAHPLRGGRLRGFQKTNAYYCEGMGEIDSDQPSGTARERRGREKH
eukprot:6235429-Pyramimonas_sp.AAC.1